MSDAGRINLYRTAVVSTLRTALPDVPDVDVQFGRLNLDELGKSIIKVPAARVSVLSASVSPAPFDQSSANLSCAAFVITEGKERDRDAWLLAEAIAMKLQPDQAWGIHKMAAPEKVKIQPILDDKIKAKGVAIIAVEWQQSIRALGDALFDENGSLKGVLYQIDGAIINDDEISVEEDANG